MIDLFCPLFNFYNFFLKLTIGRLKILETLVTIFQFADNISKRLES